MHTFSSRSQTQTRNPARIALGFTLAFLASTPAFAQVGLVPNGADLLSPGYGELPDFGSGLHELDRLGLLGLFALETLLTLALAAAIAFHPVRRRAHRDITDLVLPRLFLLYSLIGMAIGFLVVQHGYYIGFVIFGIGGLLRFRSYIDGSSNTVEAILVTLLGLCIGLNLPIMALLITIGAWIVIYATGRTDGYEIKLTCTTSAVLADQLDLLAAHIERLDWHLVSIKRPFEKPSATVVFQAQSTEGLLAVERELSKVLDADLVKWKLRT
ncbi:MAG: hypothetical protein KAS85_09260 [Rhodobacteraceae bacterium]|nr:hypothetical protein [Paracoccaceae bacterium]